MRYHSLSVRLADGLTVGPIDVHEYRSSKLGHAGLNDVYVARLL
jgi:hypothetical protein